MLPPSKPLPQPAQLVRQVHSPRPEVRQRALGRVHRPEHLDILQRPPHGPLDVAERQRVPQVDRRVIGQLAALQAAAEVGDKGGEVVRWMGHRGEVDWPR